MQEEIKSGYRRVTDILRPFTGIEFVDPGILEWAATKGTRVHKYIEDTLDGEWVPSVIDPVCLPYYSSFKTFWDNSSHQFEDCTIELEKRLYCDSLMITGQIDVVLKKPGRTYLIDWKTSSKFQKHWYLQGAAYQYLCSINNYSNVDETLFVHLRPDKKPVTYKDSNPEESLNIFKSCVKIYDHFDMEKTRINKTWR